MKKCLLLIAIIGYALICPAQKFLDIKPAKPQPGSVITITYNPKNTSLFGVKDFQAKAYLLEGKLPVVQPITLRKVGAVYTGQVKTNDTTKAVFFSFSTEEVAENNGDEGYYTMLYTKDGLEVQGANMAVASGIGNFGGIWRLKANAARAKEFTKKELARADVKEKYYNEYLFLVLGYTD